MFALWFWSDVSLVGGPITGQLPGFMVLKDFTTMRTKVIA
jgi:hypothetical protein